MEGGASRGTRCVAWPSSPSFIDGDTSDDDSDDVGWVSAASVGIGRHVVIIPSDDVAVVAEVTGDESNNSKNKQNTKVNVK